MQHKAQELGYIAVRTEHSLNGAYDATTEYVKGDLDMAANKQKQAVKEPVINDKGQESAPTANPSKNRQTSRATRRGRASERQGCRSNPAGYPMFTGNLEQLAKDAAALTKQAGEFRDGGSDVHKEFQGLSACYQAPEADQLFATTLPVKTKADDFADGLEKAAAALTEYEGVVRPLVAKLQSLRTEAFAFTDSIAGDDHWRRDQKKIDHNNRLMSDVGATISAFTDAERACHDKITALVGGSKLTVDDGSHKAGMYGYSADALQHAEETPWGGHAEREYTGLAWAWHQVKSFVWDGFIVDGIWGTIKGLGTLVGTDGWDKAGQAWTGLAKLATGLVDHLHPVRRRVLDRPRQEHAHPGSATPVPR